MKAKRRDKDVHKLVMSSYSVKLVDNKTSELIVKFHGPVGSVYEGVGYFVISAHRVNGTCM